MSEEEEELRGERWDCCVSTNYAVKCRTAPHRVKRSEGENELVIK